VTATFAAGDVLPTLLFFANSSRDSTDGRRIQEFRARLRCSSESELLFRDDHGKWLSIGVLLKVARRLRPDLIYVELFAYSGLLAAILAKTFWGCRIVVGNGDDVFGTHWKSGRYGRAIVAFTLERFLWRFADCWAVWSPYHHRWLSRRGVANVVCVPGAVNLSSMGPVSADDVRRQHGLNGHLVVGVVGNIQYSPTLDIAPGWDLLEALAQLKDLPVVGVIVGSGPGIDWLKRRSAALAIDDRVRFVGRIEHAELAAYYSALDVGLVTFSNDLDGRFTWTAKLPEYLACNVFPVMTDIERSRRFVRKCGALLPFDGARDATYPSRLARLLRGLTQNRVELDRRRDGRRIASSLLEFDVAARHLQRGIRRALHRN
jgi:glycosyltransferase involved in cell wall biosynthesis